MNLKMLLFASVSLVLFASCHNSDDPYMTLATKTLDVEAEGGLFTVDLSSNVYYRVNNDCQTCLLYTSPSPRDGLLSRMPSSA